MIGLVVCGVLAACNSLKTTTDKLYQRIDYYCMLIYAQFNFARYQTTLFVEFSSEKIGQQRLIKLAYTYTVERQLSERLLSEQDFNQSHWINYYSYDFSKVKTKKTRDYCTARTNNIQ